MDVDVESVFHKGNECFPDYQVHYTQEEDEISAQDPLGQKEQDQREKEGDEEVKEPEAVPWPIFCVVGLQVEV